MILKNLAFWPVYESYYTTFLEGEMNSGGYIYWDAKRRGIYLVLLTDPERDSCFSINFTKSDG